jgi:PAS domain S-box-containing protein
VALDAEAAVLSAANLALERRVRERTAALSLSQQLAEQAAAERVAILSQLAEGVIVADEAGLVTFVNDAAARIHGVAELGVAPTGYAQHYHLMTEDGRPHPWEDLPLTRAVVKGEVVSDARWRIRRPDGAEVVAAGSARPLRDAEGRQVGAVLTLRDETARHHAELALAASEAEFRAIFDTAAVGVTEVCVATGRYIRVNRRFCELVGQTEQTIIGDGLGPIDLTHPEDRGISAVAQAAVSADGRHEAEKRYVFPTGEVIWVRVSAAVAARDDQGRPTRTVAVVQDVTERRQAERRQALLMAELNHRVKNVLATVQAIANQTLRGAGGDPARFAADFTGRLSVLARAHDLLTANAWQAAELGALARAALAPWLAAESSRVELTGLDGVHIGPRQAQALVLGLHELATNAAKHGALSRPRGQVALRGVPEAENRLRLSWQEQGGPVLAGQPSRRGFGTRLLERGLASDLGPDARVTLTYAPDGLVAEILFRADGPDDV